MSDYFSSIFGRLALYSWVLALAVGVGTSLSVRAQAPVAPAAYNALYAAPAAVAARRPRLVRYDLHVRDTTWTIAGVSNHALATNGSIPAPTLTFTEGDTALIYLHNQTRKTVSFHWHGLLLPNRYDGVPMLNTELIEPGQVHEFRFALKQHGTSWYHSHTRLNEQLGQYGAIVIYPPTPLAMPDQVVLLSDWTKENPWEVLRSLKRETDWYAIQRGSVQSYGLALATNNLGTKLRQEWKRMPEMDLADVYYQSDLVNGQPTRAAPLAPGQSVRLRLINGSAASYFWVQFAGGKMRVVAADGVDVQPVPVDKLLIGTAETYDVEVTLPAAAGQYELRATSWDMAKHTSLLLGTGPLHAAPDLPKIDYFQLVKEMSGMMSQMKGMTMGRAPADVPPPSVAAAGSAPMPDMPGMDSQGMAGAPRSQPATMPGMKMPADSSAHSQPAKSAMPGMAMAGGDGMQMAGMKMGGMKKAPLGTFVTGYKQLQAAFPNETLLNYEMLKAPQPTTIPADRPVRTVQLYLTGNMFRYVWSINNKTLSDADKIEIKQGETVRFVMHNTTMMSHPMHLHGHFFRVLNGQGDSSPLKNTLSVAPMDVVTIEFDANEEKDWFFHCHLLYHLNSGMARIVHYANTAVPLDNPRRVARFTAEDRALFPYARVDAFSQGVFAQGGVRNSYWLLRADAALNYRGSYETETHVQRYLGPKQFVAVYAGTDIRNNTRGGANTATDAPGQPTRSDNSKDFRQVACVGIRYFLPLLVWSDLRLDHQGKIRLQLEREGLPITRRLRADLMVNSDREYRLGSSYILGKYVALAGNYDSNYGWGVGLRLIY